MKLLVKIILIAIMSLIAVGYYFKNTNNPKGEVFIGIGIMSIVFILMPLFLYSRYRDKKMTSFIYKHDENNQE